jgi:ATP-dependent protease ClpP protease subunit
MDISEIIKRGLNKKHDGFSTKPVANLHEFYLTGEIGEAEDYLDWFDAIRHAGELDVVKIYINSFGGDLFTAIQFLRVLSESQATKIISVEGACMSAATMIFMCGDQFEVTPHSVFMFHNYSGGTIGKGGEMIDQLQHERKWSERLLNEVYKGFLTKEEIHSMLANKDIWMDGDEVVRRINLKNKGLVADQKSKTAPKPRQARAKKSKTSPVQ